MDNDIATLPKPKEFVNIIKGNVGVGIVKRANLPTIFSDLTLDLIRRNMLLTRRERHHQVELLLRVSPKSPHPEEAPREPDDGQDRRQAHKER